MAMTTSYDDDCLPPNDGDEVAMGGGMVSRGGNSAGTSTLAPASGVGGGGRSVGELGRCADGLSLAAGPGGMEESRSDASGMRGRASVVGVLRDGGGSSRGMATADDDFLIRCWDEALTTWLDSSSESNAGDDDPSTSTFFSWVEKVVVTTAVVAAAAPRNSGTMSVSSRE